MNRFFSRACATVLLCLGFFAATPQSRADAMLQLFNVNWDELITKMPEIAEAGYTSLWLPPPTKGGSGYSVGYDVFDPFDLGDKDQRGTVRTRYGTKTQLVRVVEMAHRFGIRVYFDNIMNHRGFDVPQYNASASSNVYPGMVTGDFHLQRISGGFYRNWNDIGNWNDTFEIQNNPLGGLIDIAQESPNDNFGVNYKDQAPSPFFIRHPNNPEYYYDTNLPSFSGGMHGFNGTNGDPVAENTASYLIRSVLYLLDQTKCDGFRLDAVKHVPDYFFGDYGSATANGYLGRIQSMFDWVHGYGNNVLGNGYVEADDNRNSNYDSEAVRNDALLFGEHLGEPPSYDGYLGRGMRLLDNPLRNNLNNILGNPSSSLAGYEQRDAGGFSAPNRVMHAQSHDNGYANHRELQNAFYFFREGIPLIYSDGYNQESGDNPFPRVASAPYLGEFGDNKMPDLMWLHGQLARGGTRSRWGDSDVVAFERYDYREGGSAADQTVVLFAMNDNFGNPGDVSFDDGVAQNDSGMPSTCYPVVNSRNQGLVVGFPPGSWLTQMADSPGKDRACPKVLVRLATNLKSDADATKNDPNPVNRKVYVGSQTLASGGGAIEFKIPSGGYVAYAYQWPEASRASGRDAIIFRHNGNQVPTLTVTRTDGRDGDSGFNPLYPFKMRGSVDTGGNVVRGVNLGTRTYAIDIPIVTNALMDIVVRPDASVNNVLVKLDGGMDLNSQMSMGSTNAADPRDNRPGYATDVFLGYEQAQFRYRRGPEKFASTNIANNTVVSVGAGTYSYTVGNSGAAFIVDGSGGGAGVNTSAAEWVFHNPNVAVTGGASPPATQRVPLAPTSAQSVTVWAKVGYQFDINNGRLYYTTDGTNPEGSFGRGRGTTITNNMSFDHTEVQVDGTVDWWKGTIPAQPNGTQVKYKVAFYNGDTISPIADSNSDKLYGATEFSMLNWNPTTARVWLHNDLNTNSTRTGLEEGFHIVRARAFLSRSGKSSVFNTFSQTFYYDAAPPDGVIAFPSASDTLSSQQYGVVVRADANVTSVEYNISDSNPANDDVNTGIANGNGTNASGTIFVVAHEVTPNTGLNATYPNFPREYRFTYNAVPATSNATITVRLKKLTSTVLTNRVTLRTRTVVTAAPAQTLDIAFPSSDGQTLNLSPNSSYGLVFRFSDTLTANITNFTIAIDGGVQPRYAPDGTNAFYFFQDQTGGDGKNELRYNWTNIPPGQHVIEVFFNGNSLALQAQRFVNVQISGATVSIVNPPAADSQGRSPYEIVLPSQNGVPLANTFPIEVQTPTNASNIFISFSTNAFVNGFATRDTSFTGNIAEWDFAWTNLVQGTFTIRADAVIGGVTNSATRVAQILYAPVDQFRLIAPSKYGDTFTFSIQTLDGRTYVVEYSDDLANPDWHSMPNVNGDGSVKVVNDTAPGVPQRFYRFRTL